MFFFSNCKHMAKAIIATPICFCLFSLISYRSDRCNNMKGSCLLLGTYSRVFCLLLGPSVGFDVCVLLVGVLATAAVTTTSKLLATVCVL